MRESATELWAVLDEDSRVVRTRGGSSTSHKLMVYSCEHKAKAALNNRWIKQVHDVSRLRIERIYG